MSETAGTDKINSEGDAPTDIDTTDPVDENVYETDNSPREEDGPQDGIDQEPDPAEGSVTVED